jgi:hypothetical protein
VSRRASPTHRQGHRMGLATAVDLPVDDSRRRPVGLLLDPGLAEVPKSNAPTPARRQPTSASCRDRGVARRRRGPRSVTRPDPSRRRPYLWDRASRRAVRWIRIRAGRPVRTMELRAADGRRATGRIRCSAAAGESGGTNAVRSRQASSSSSKLARSKSQNSVLALIMPGASAWGSGRTSGRCLIRRAGNVLFATPPRLATTVSSHAALSKRLPATRPVCLQLAPARALRAAGKS